MDLTDRIVADTAVQHGKPVIRGTRVPVARLISAVAGGMTAAEAAEAYGVGSDDVRAALDYAVSLVEQEEIYPIPG